MYTIRQLSPKDFPQNLAEIPDPPHALNIVGTLPAHTEYLAVVGSRNHTHYGREVCEKIIKDLAGYPITIVSGLALGIDSIAHKMALAVGLTTVAFPGSGLSPEALYPRSHMELAKAIIKSGGALISEFENNFKATPYSFPQRNRLMAGISRGVLIIEAEEQSGTLITARLGLDYNKDIFAVPGSIFSHGSIGTNRLIKEGAIPVTDGRDILRQWNIEEEKQNKIFEFTPSEQEIIDALREPLFKDELLTLTSLPISEFNIALGTLELKGAIKQTLGKIRRT